MYPISVDTLIEDIKVTCSFPNSAALMSDDEIVRRLTLTQTTELVPLINSLRAEYFVVVTDVALVANTFEYELPFRSVGCKLRDISLIDHNGNEIYLPQLDPSQIKMPGGIRGYSTLLPTPYGYFFQYNKVKLFFGTPDNNSIVSSFPTLRFKYYRQPNMLLLNSSGTTVTTISGTQITVPAVPTTWVAGTKIDIISSDPIFVSRVDDMEIASISMNTITFTTTVPTTVVADDLVCPARFTTTPQLPVECFTLLTQLVAVDIFSILGDVPGHQTASIELKSMREAFLSEFSPRNEGTSIKINSYNTLFDSFWY